MVDIVLEVFRAVVLLGAVIFLWIVGRNRFEASPEGWRLIVGGFALLLFGSLLDITDNFESLNGYVVIGDTEAEAFLEKVVGFLGGFVLLSIGLVRWMPRVQFLVREVSQRKRAEEELRKARDELEARVEERTTRLKTVNEALQESEALFRAFIDNLPVEIFIRDADGRFVLVNRAWERAQGLSSEEAIGNTARDIFPMDRADAFIAQDDVVLKTGQVLDREVEFQTQGASLFLHTIKFPIPDVKGDTTAIGGIAVDITERKRAEESLKASEAQLRLVVDNLPALIVYIDADQRFRLINRTCAAWYGRPATEIIGKRVAEIHGDRYALFKPHIDAVLSGETLTFETEAVYPTGERRDIRSVHVPHIDSQGTVRGYFSLTQDITQSKRAEDEIRKLNENLERRVEERTEELRESEMRLTAILDHSPAAIYLKDLEGRFLLANKTYFGWYGLEPAEFAGSPGKTSHELFSRELAEAFVSQDRKVMETGTVVTCEFEEPLDDGQVHTLVMTKFPVFGPDGAVVAVGGVDIDITERKRAEVALREAQDELIRQARLATLGQLTATVSHELRNPLGVIRTSAFILREGLNGEAPRIERSLERIERSVIRCDRIIDELLDFTRISEIQAEPTAIDAWLDETLNEQTVPSAVRLRRDFGLGEVTVSFDRDRFRRAIINVFDNGCQAMIGEGLGDTGSEDRSLTVRTQEHDGRVEVILVDTGPGIAPDVYEKIFEPLYSTKGFGVGLGLPVVRQIMRQHGGGIEIESEEGRGTRVCLWLPHGHSTD